MSRVLYLSGNALSAAIANLRGLTAFGTTRFDTAAAVYAIMEAILIVAVAFIVANVYWMITVDWTPPFLDAFAPSLFLGLCIFAITVAGDRLSLAKRSGAAFLWTAVDATLGAFAFLVALLFVFKLSDSYSRTVTAIQFSSVLATMLLCRAQFMSLVRERIARGSLETGRFVIIGRLARHPVLNQIARHGGRIVACFADCHMSDNTPADFARKVVETCRNEHVDHVVITHSLETDDLAKQIVDALVEAPVTVHVCPEWVDQFSFQRRSVAEFGLPTAIVASRPLTNFEVVIKRSVDIFLSTFGLIIFSPILLAVSLAIRLESKGPIFFRQTRHGYGNKTIRVFKFRSMNVLEDGKAFRQATKNDPRITRVGRFIRRYNLDELPQLINVFIGEMSMVGPRPHPVALNESFADRIRWFHRRHVIRPGITGWAQINGFRGETETLEKMAGRVEHDLWYLDNWSLHLDAKIILLTIFSPVAYRNAR